MTMISYQAVPPTFYNKIAPMNLWNLNGFINDIPLPCRRLKKTVKQFCSSNQNATCT